MVCGYVVDEVGGGVWRGVCEIVESVLIECGESVWKVREILWREYGDILEKVWRQCGEIVERVWK